MELNSCLSVIDGNCSRVVCVCHKDIALVVSISAPAHLLVFFWSAIDRAEEWPYFLWAAILSSSLQQPITAEHLESGLLFFVSAMNFQRYKVELCLKDLHDRTCRDIFLSLIVSAIHILLRSICQPSLTYLLCQLGSGSCKTSFYRCDSSPFPGWSLLFRKGRHHPG